MGPRRVITFLIALMLCACGAVPVLGGGTAQAATRCTVDYAVNDWGGGFTATVTLHNTGDAINGWRLTFSYAGNQKLSQGWNGTWSQSGHDVTVTNASWNAALASGATAQVGG